MANSLSWYDTVLFPSTGYLETLLEFLILYNSSTKSNKKVAFHVITNSSLLLMISRSLISCTCKLFFAHKTSAAAVDTQHLKVEVADKDFLNCSYVINRTCQYLMLIM